MGMIAALAPRRWRSLAARALPVVVACLIVLVFAGLAIWRDFQREREQAAARLESVSELRATQVQAWLERHMSFARFLAGSTQLAELYVRWREQGDEAAGRTLLARAIDSRHADGADSALLADAQRDVIAREHPADRVVSAQLRQGVLQAVAAGAALNSSIYNRAGTEIPQRLDIVVPLLRTGTPAHGAIVLRVDPRRSLLPIVSGWPVPSASAESVLWNRVGDEFSNISDLHGEPASLGRIHGSVASSDFAVARLMRGDLPHGVPVEALDYRGVRVLLVGRQVAGTGWWLVAKADLADVDAPAWQHARETLLATLLALLGAALAARVWSQRRTIDEQQRERAAQLERLRALAMLEAITRSASDAIFAQDLEGRYVYCNRAAAEFAGRSTQDVLGRTSAEVFGTETAARMAQDDRRVLAGELSGAYEEDIATPRGVVHVLTTKGPLVDAEGTLLGLLGVSRDVTEMREAQRALRDSEAHHRTLVSVLSEGILVTDAQGRVVSCNPAAERMLGATLAEWQGRDAIAPGWNPMRLDGTAMPAEELPASRVMAGEGPQRDTVLLCLGPGGLPTWFHVSAVPIVSPDTGQLVAVVTSFSDVTLQRQMEDELRRSRDELEGLVAARTRELTQANATLADTARFSREITDAIPGLVTYWDGELRCRFANRTYLEWFQRSAEQVIGHTRAEIFGPAHDDAVKDRLLLALQGEQQVFDFQPRVSPGGDRHYQVHYTPARGDDGAVHGVYMMAFDISALKRAEELLTRVNVELARSRDEAETANRAKSAFVANMSHEIRTPLNGILGLAWLLARDPRDAVQRERLGKIGDAGQHLLQIINDILDLSKIEAGKLTLEETDFSLDTLLSTACDMVGERARAKGLELVVDTDHVPRRLRGDPTRLSQMILNLLSNAVKFTERGWVRLKGDLLDERDGRVLVRFEVRDTGEGIPLERQSELFNAFEQGDNTTTRRFGGTGLGLSLTRNLAAAMNGTVGLASAPGAGSTFWFTAWLAHAQRDEDGAALAAMKALRVLLVDDLAEAAAVIAGYLRAMGMQVDAPDSDDVALQRVEAAMMQGRPYDLMLVDSSARGRDGEPTLARLHALMGEGMPPCVLLASA
ncbi:MAG: PAS domain-containing protein, partial [Betaproteobacteria bacterium]